MSVSFAHFDEKPKVAAVRWLVSVEGFDGNYSPPDTRTTVVVVLPEDETPVEWMLTRPTCYQRFSFTPSTLLGFWRIGKTLADLSDGPIVMALADVGPGGEKKRSPTNDLYDDDEDDDDELDVDLPRHYAYACDDEYEGGSSYLLLYKKKEIGTVTKTRKSKAKDGLWTGVFHHQATSKRGSFEDAMMFVVNSDVAWRSKKGRE